MEFWTLFATLISSAYKLLKIPLPGLSVNVIQIGIAMLVILLVIRIVKSILQDN